MMLLAEIEAYYDAVPRTSARTEQIAPFTLFHNPGPGFPFYARPSLGSTSFVVEDVQRVRARQRELGVPEAFEWVAETTPGLAGAVEAAGLVVRRLPLMALEGDARQLLPWPDGIEVRFATVEDDLQLLSAIGHVAFGAPGTAVGAAGLMDARQLVERDPSALAAQQERLRAGWTVTAVAFFDGDDPVGVGRHQPLGPATEVVGVAVLPAFRRRGIAAALTSRLVEDALERGVRTVFLSASDEAVARVYARLGFRHIGTACIAEHSSE